jgi:hypothetical protein
MKEEPEIIRCPKCERQVKETDTKCPMCFAYLQVPEPKDKYISAFLCLMLHKLGGYQTIPLKNLDNFNMKNRPELHWDPDKQAFTLANPGKEPKSKIIHNDQIITPN